MRGQDSTREDNTGHTSGQSCSVLSSPAAKLPSDHFIIICVGLWDSRTVGTVQARGPTLPPPSPRSGRAPPLPPALLTSFIYHTILQISTSTGRLGPISEDCHADLSGLLPQVICTHFTKKISEQEFVLLTTRICPYCPLYIFVHAYSSTMCLH